MHNLPGSLQIGVIKESFTGLVGGLVDNSPELMASCSVSYVITMALTKRLRFLQGFCKVSAWQGKLKIITLEFVLLFLFFL